MVVLPAVAVYNSNVGAVNTQRLDLEALFFQFLVQQILTRIELVRCIILPEKLLQIEECVTQQPPSVPAALLQWNHVSIVQPGLNGIFASSIPAELPAE